MAETIASLAVRIGADLSDFEKKMKEFKRSFSRVGQQVQEAGTAIGTAFTAAGGAIAAGLGFAVSKAADFDSQMSRVGAIAGATGSELSALRQTALDLGASTSKSATEVAQGMELMAAMGFKTNEVIAAMPGVISAAEASGEDMAMVAETVASALNSFKLQASDASRVADVLAQAANDSAAGIRDMQYSFKYAAPVAAQLGISLEQLAAATEIMANSGIKGEQAGTTLRAALLRLADPPKEAAEQLEALGIKVTDSQGRMLPFDNIVKQLSDSLKGMGNAQQAAALAAIFGTEAASGMLTVIQAGPEKLNELTKALQNAKGASADTAAKMKDNLKGALEELGGAVETAQISIGSALAPALRSIAESIQVVIDAFNSLSPTTKQFIAIGAAVSAVVMALIGVVGFLVAGLGVLAAAEWAVILPIAGIVAGIALAIAALVGLGYALVQAYQQSEMFRNVVNQLWEGLKAGVQAVWDFVSPIIQNLTGFILAKFTEVQQWWFSTWPTLQQAFMNIWNAIWAFIQPIVNAIVAIMQWAWPFIKEIVFGTLENIKGIISGALDVIMGIVNLFANLFTGNWSGVWESVKQIFSGALKLIWNWIQVWGLGKILKFAGFLGGEVGRIFKALWDSVKGIFDDALGWIFSLVKGRFDNILGFLKGLGSMFYNAGKGLLDMMRRGIEAAADAVISAIKGIAQKVRNFLPFSPAKEGPLSDLDKLDFAGPISDSIIGVIPKVQTLMDTMLTVPDIQPSEYVLPDANDSNYNSLNRDPGQPLEIHLKLDGRTISRSLFLLQNGSLRALGVNS
jgi:TP901 family phage tail tape measure protein